MIINNFKIDKPKHSLIICLIGLLLCGTQPSIAAEPESESAPANNQQDKPVIGFSIFRDCGLGAVIYGGPGEDERRFAALANIMTASSSPLSSLSSVSSYTSATCTRSQSDLIAAAIIYDAYDSVVAETAQGSGDYLDSVLTLLAVPESDRNDVIQTAQTKLATAITTDNYGALSRLTKADQFFNYIDPAIN